MFRNKGHQIKYLRQESTQTPVTLREIPSGVLNRLAKPTSRNTSIHSEVEDKIYPDYVNDLRKAGVDSPTFPTMGDLWRKHDEKVDSENE